MICSFVLCYYFLNLNLNNFAGRYSSTSNFPIAIGDFQMLHALVDMVNIQIMQFKVNRVKIQSAGV